MAELFQITKGQKAIPINDFPFQDELNDLEPFVKENHRILGENIEVLEEQLDTGTGQKIDLLALDRSAEVAQITLIELKAGLAQHEVLLQTLRYANWVNNNPDSIRYLLEKKRLSGENLNFTPKIMIVAPQIDPALLELSQYIEAFEFDFIEVRRFGTKENCFLAIDHKTLLQTSTTKVRAPEKWNWDRYESELGISKDQTEIGKALFKRIETICQDRQWNLTPRFNQAYVTFKFGSRNVILINYWIKSKLCYLGFKLGQPPQQPELVDPYPSADHKYYPDYGEYHVRVEKSDTDITGYIPFMETAYRNVTKE